MIGHHARGMLNKSLQQQSMYGSVVQCASRGFAGGGGEKKKPMPKDATDFDVVLVGKCLRNVCKSMICRII